MDKLTQVIIDISVTAGAMIANNRIPKIDVTDSREFNDYILECAKEFCAKYPQNIDNYIEEVDSFAEFKLLQWDN